MKDYVEVNEDWKFDPESADGWYRKLNAQQKTEFGKFAQRLAYPRKEIPDNYRGSVKRMNEEYKMNVSPSMLMDEQVYEIDQYLARTWRNQTIILQLMEKYDITSYMRNPSWISKHYTVEDGQFPELTTGGPSAFRVERSGKLGVEPTSYAGLGAAIRIDLSWTLLAEAGDGPYDPEMWHNQETMKNFGIFWDERLCLGSAGEHMDSDTGTKGIHNFAGLSTEAIGAGNDNDVKAAGDIDDAIFSMLDDLSEIYEPGPIVLLSTSGPAAEVYLHDSSTSDRTEYERVKKKWFDSGILAAWVIDNNIEKDANSDTTGRFQLVKMSPHTMKREVIYPFQKKPNINTEFADDIAYTYLTADIFKYYNAAAGTICSGDVTTTVKGMFQNGIFMEGKKFDAPLTPPRMPTFYPTVL